MIVVNYNGSFGEYPKSIEMIEETEGVLHNPFVYSEMMIRSAKGAGNYFKGIDTESVTQVTDIGAKFDYGSQRSRSLSRSQTRGRR